MEHWIKLRKTLIDDGRVLSIAKKMKQHPTRIVGCLAYLWFSGDTHTTDGKIPYLTPEGLDAHVGLDGFSAELVKIGWIRFSEQGGEILKFDEHNGRGAKRRATEYARKLAAREFDTVSDGANVDGKSLADGFKPR
jgi:hypothetical protein